MIDIGDKFGIFDDKRNYLGDGTVIEIHSVDDKIDGYLIDLNKKYFRVDRTNLYFGYFDDEQIRKMSKETVIVAGVNFVGTIDPNKEFEYSDIGDKSQESLVADSNQLGAVICPVPKLGDQVKFRIGNTQKFGIVIESIYNDEEFVVMMRGVDSTVRLDYRELTVYNGQDAINFGEYVKFAGDTVTYDRLYTIIASNNSNGSFTIKNLVTGLIMSTPRIYLRFISDDAVKIYRNSYNAVLVPKKKEKVPIAWQVTETKVTVTLYVSEPLPKLNCVIIPLYS